MSPMSLRCPEEKGTLVYVWTGILMHKDILESCTVFLWVIRHLSPDKFLEPYSHPLEHGDF